MRMFNFLSHMRIQDLLRDMRMQDFLRDKAPTEWGLRVQLKGKVSLVRDIWNYTQRHCDL